MIIIDFINRLLGKPPLLPNGYPNMAANHDYIYNDNEIIRDVTRRWNGGNQRGFHMIPPPPPIHQHPLPVEKPEPPMVADIIDKITTKVPVRETPTTTSSLSFHELWCGSTVSDFAKETKEEKDPLALDHLPLKHFLVKKYPWILDVTEVRVRPLGRLTHPIYESTIIYGPLEIHITVSPTHHSELMSPDIEKKVREKLYADMIPLITCMYENNHKDRPIIIFSPSHSETILEYVK
jgi:hypothetical protein